MPNNKGSKTPSKTKGANRSPTNRAASRGGSNKGSNGGKVLASNSSPVCRRNVFSHRNGIPRNNCYAWALQLGRKDGPFYKLQPGDLSTKKSFDLDSCSGVRQRTLEDLKIVGGYEEKLRTTCRDGYYKIALILSKNMDYHYLLLHKDVMYVAEKGDTRDSIAKKFGVKRACVEAKRSYTPGASVYIKNANVWSHKRGAAYAPTLVDSKNRIIKDPTKASFDYGMLNYDIYCTSFCVRRRLDRAACTVRNSTCKKDNIKRLTVTKGNVPPKTIQEVINQLKKRIINSKKNPNTKKNTVNTKKTVKTTASNNNKKKANGKKN